MMAATLTTEPVPLSLVRDVALFLDIDGTLLEIAALPDAVVVPDALRETLATLRDGLDGALALVSGRPIAQIDQLFKPLRLAASGEHGFELRLTPTAAINRAEAPEAIARLHPKLIELARRMPGVLPEFKTSTIALHFRQMPALAEPLLAAIEALIAPDRGTLAIQPGKMVYEIKPRGIDKGRAVAGFLASAPFAGRRPVYVGDDLTDSYGFAAVKARNGIAVGVGSTAYGADQALASPAAVRAWLRRMAAAICGTNSG